METGRLERKKSCTVCKTEFSCYTHDCWCAALPNIMPLTSNGDCLCPDCLKKVIEERSKKSPSGA